METEAKLVVLMSLIDESLARIFLLETPLKGAVAKTVDLAEFEQKLQKFESFFDASAKENCGEKKAAHFGLAKEAVFSKVLCDYYLEWLLPKRPAFRLKKIDSKAVTALAQNYRRILNKIIAAGGKE